MKIGVLGNGNVGGRLANLAKTCGHDVRVGSRSGDVSLVDTAAHGDIVILAVHYHAASDVLTPLADPLAGKILVDATNPLNDDWSPRLLGQETSAAEEIAKLMQGVRVVKAFNTIFADVMDPAHQDRDGHKITSFVAGDDPDAVATVAELADSMGFAPVTVTKLSSARYLEAMAHLNIELAVGQSGGTDAAILYHRAGAS
ncbi:MAG: NAD(P)-binding domain-containing protein [Pseudomonadota bacterium]